MKKHFLLLLTMCGVGFGGVSGMDQSFAAIRHCMRLSRGEFPSDDHFEPWVDEVEFTKEILNNGAYIRERLSDVEICPQVRVICAQNVSNKALEAIAKTLGGRLIGLHVSGDERRNSDFTDEGLRHVADNCPNIRELVLDRTGWDGPWFAVSETEIIRMQRLEKLHLLRAECLADRGDKRLSIEKLLNGLNKATLQDLKIRLSGSMWGVSIHRDYSDYSELRTFTHLKKLHLATRRPCIDSIPDDVEEVTFELVAEVWNEELSTRFIHLKKLRFLGIRFTENAIDAQTKWRRDAFWNSLRNLRNLEELSLYRCDFCRKHLRCIPPRVVVLRLVDCLPQTDPQTCFGDLFETNGWALQNLAYLKILTLSGDHFTVNDARFIPRGVRELTLKNWKGGVLDLRHLLYLRKLDTPECTFERIDRAQ